MPITSDMRQAYRVGGGIAFLLMAALAGIGSVIAADHTKCTDSGTVAVLILGAGAVAVIAAVRVARVQLRWAILAAMIYSAAVYVEIGLTAIANCTA